MGHKINVPIASIMALTLAGMNACPPIDKDAEDFYDFMGVDYAKEDDQNEFVAVGPKSEDEIDEEMKEDLEDC